MGEQMYYTDIITFTMGIGARKKVRMTRAQRQYKKALETLVYIANKEHRSYWALKIIYLADKEHLGKYGRQIFGDSYRAMKYGPVPSLAYDIVKNVRGDGWERLYKIFIDPNPNTALRVPDEKTIFPLRESDTRLLSDSEIECLDNAYNRIQNLTFAQVKKLCHDSAYDAVEQDEEMTLKGIINTLKNKDEVFSYRKCN